MYDLRNNAEYIMHIYDINLMPSVNKLFLNIIEAKLVSFIMNALDEKQ